MDQTISIMGEPNCAKLIDFIPQIKATTVSVPKSVSLVITNSCTPSPKVLTVGTRYNKRVVECRMALAAMAIKADKCDLFEDCKYKTFRDLQDDLGFSFEQMLKLVEESFSRKSEYTPQMISKEFDVEDPFIIVRDVPHYLEVKNRNASFDLYKRAFHVLSEAKRVHDFKKVCEDDSLDEETKVTRLGELMNQSQESCKDLYDCSSE